MSESAGVPGKKQLPGLLYSEVALRSCFALALMLAVALTVPGGLHAIPKAHATGSTPIQHIVYIIKENHSFDSYFGRFPGANGATTGLVKVNGIDQQINLIPLIDQSRDFCHVRPCSIKDYDKGAMDHFNSGVNCAQPPYNCYQAATQDQIPNYWDLASKFVLSDETFQPVAGPTFPNRLFTIAAASGSSLDTSAVALPTLPGHKPGGWGCDSVSGTTVLLYNGTKVYPCFDFPTLADSMDNAGVSWKYYAPVPGEGGYIFSAYDAINHIRNGVDWTQNVVPWQNFVTDALAGNLPAFSWLVPPIADSEHPPASVCVGENWTVQQLNAVMQGSDWASTAIFLSYDEWGGFYDHQAPVSVDALGDGFRVPMTIISPYAHSTDPIDSHMSHTQYEASSVIRFAEEVFNLPSLGNRDSIVNDMMDSFDFSQVWNAPDILNIRSCGPLKSLPMPDSD